MVPFTVMICKTRNLDPCKLTDSCDISSSSNSNRSLWSFNSLTSCLGKKKKSFNIYSAGTSHIMKYTRDRELLSSIADMSNKIWLSVCIQEILVVKKTVSTPVPTSIRVSIPYSETKKECARVFEEVRSA